MPVAGPSELRKRLPDSGTLHHLFPMLKQSQVTINAVFTILYYIRSNILYIISYLFTMFALHQTKYTTHNIILLPLRVLLLMRHSRVVLHANLATAQELVTHMFQCFTPWWLAVPIRLVLASFSVVETTNLRQLLLFLPGAVLLLLLSMGLMVMPLFVFQLAQTCDSSSVDKKGWWFSQLRPFRPKT